MDANEGLKALIRLLISQGKLYVPNCHRCGLPATREGGADPSRLGLIVDACGDHAGDLVWSEPLPGAAEIDLLRAWLVEG